MNVPTTTAPNSAQSKSTALKNDFGIVGLVYVIAGIFASMTVSACGPGCCFVAFEIMAAISGVLLMIRPRLAARIFCFIMLCVFLYGIWHEKSERDTWQENSLRRQLQEAFKRLEQLSPSGAQPVQK